MNGKFSAILAVFVVCVGRGSSQGNANSSKVDLTVYFEGLCYDSQQFYLNQLIPTYEKLSSYMTVHLIPYGKATTTQTGPHKWEFRCQHGPKECLLNKMMACGNYILGNVQDKDISFDGCVMDLRTGALTNPGICAERAGIDAAKLLNCTTSDLGSSLLNEMGKLTPRLRFVPKIDVNGESKPEDQSDILRDLTSYVCNKLSNQPEPCQEIEFSGKATRWYDFLFLG